jgi:hypothetical protein
MILLVDTKTRAKVSDIFRRTQKCVLTYCQELKEVFVLTCSFAHIPISEFSPADPPGDESGYYIGHCECRMGLCNGILSVHITWNKMEMCGITIQVM